MALAGWQHTGNPVYIWRAIDIYAKNSTLLPPAVFDYLSATARRMDKARATKDLRSALPVIMGFRTKRGPGRPLDPDSTDPDRLDLAILFGIELESDTKASVGVALRRAAGRVSHAYAKAHERTLKGWVAEALALDPRPRTKAEWRAAVRDALGGLARWYDNPFETGGSSAK